MTSPSASPTLPAPPAVFGPPLHGLRAVVTGGGSGIGRAACEALAAGGADVAVFDVDGAAAEAVAAGLRARGARALALAGSVAESAAVDAAFAAVDAAWGGLDILVNNAGVAANRPTLELADEDWRRACAVNLDGTFFCCRAAGRRMVPAGRGAIVNIGSIYSTVAAPNRLAYCATKAGVGMLTRSLAIEWAGHGVRVNAVAPGYVDTPLLAPLVARGAIDPDALRRRTPLGRLAQPEDIAQAIVYLCEPRSAYITGQVLHVDGGWTAYGYV